MNDLEERFNKLRRFNATLETSTDKDVEENVELDKGRLKKDMVELIANQIYDKLTKLFNDTRKRLGVKGGANIRGAYQKL